MKSRRVTALPLTPLNTIRPSNLEIEERLVCGNQLTGPGNQKSCRINQKVLARQPLRQSLHQGCRFNVIAMITLNALHSDWLTTASTPSARRLWRTWTTQYPALAEHPGPAEAIASTRNKATCPAPVLNAFIALSAEHTLARYAIVERTAQHRVRRLAHRLAERVAA
jgi:hypothetical protein